MYHVLQTGMCNKVLKLLILLHTFLHIIVIFDTKESKVAFFTVFVYFCIVFFT